MAIDIWQIFNLENQFISSILILVAFFIIAKIVVIISERVILRLTKKTKTNVDDLIVKKSNRKISLILVLIGIKLALIPLGLTETINQIANKIIGSAIIIVIALIVITIFDILIEFWGKSFAKKTKSKLDDQLILLFHRFSKIIFFLLTFLFILQTWNIQIGTLLASLGIVGLAVAFALQSSLGNIFGGISLIMDKSIRVGDRIKLESGESGIVDDVGLRSTKIKTWDNQIIVVPNGKLADSKIINYLHRGEKRVRVVVEFGVVYGSNLDKVKKTIIPELKKIKECLKYPAPEAYFKEMSDFSLNFQAKFWVSDVSKAHMAKQEANINIYNALNKARINIPFPTQTIYVKKK